MRTTKGLRKVDVIYRRIDDDFLDPQAFRADSLLGVPGLMDAYRAGQRGAGQRARQRRGRRQSGLRLRARHDPVLPRAKMRFCPTCRPFCAGATRIASTCWQNLDKLVVKAANEAGGYGMLVGPHSTAAQREEFAGEDRRESAQLHRAADAGAVARADA